MTIAVDWDLKQQNKQTHNIFKKTNNRTFVFNAYKVYFTCLNLDRYTSYMHKTDKNSSLVVATCCSKHVSFN